MKEIPFRIGLMGSSCSGKTTTAGLLAFDFGLELQEEYESGLLTQWIAEGRIPSKEGFTPPLSLAFQEASLQTREQNAQRVIRGISDRTAVDLLAYHILHVQPHVSSRITATFTERCRSVMETYTHLFLFPQGVLPIETNGLRTVDSEYQRAVHQAITRSLGTLGLEYTPLTSEPLSIEDRVGEIKECLKI